MKMEIFDSFVYLKYVQRQFDEYYEKHIFKNISFAMRLGAFLSVAALVISEIISPETMDIWEVLAVTSGFFCTALCVTQNRLQYLFGIVAVAASAYVFYEDGLFAVSIFNAVMVFSLVYGWFKWKADIVAIPVTYATLNEYVVYAIYGLLSAFVLISLFNVLGAEYLMLDVTVTSLSAIAQLMLDRKNRDTWIFWLIVNILSMKMFWSAGLYMVFVQYIFFTANVFFGWFSWKVDSK